MIKGERIRLRALEPEDARVIAEWYRNHEFAVLDGNVYGSSYETIEAFVRTLVSPSFSDASFGIEDEHGALIGYVRLKRTSQEDRSADFGIAIGPEHWNRGYGTDATRRILRFAFEEMNLHRVALGVREENARARRCYEKCGFVEEGREREAKYRDGAYRDNVLMSVLEDEWRAAALKT